MPSQSTAASQAVSCDWCSDSFAPDAGVKGSFCSTECWRAHRRQKQATDICNQLKYDHRFCFTCFRQLKEVELPPNRWGLPDCVVGFQYRTEDADVGDRSIIVKPNDRSPTEPTTAATRGTICKCGNTQHQTRIDEFRSRFTFEYAGHLVESLAILEAEGKLAVDVDVQQLFEALIRERQCQTTAGAEATTDVDDPIESALPAALELDDASAPST